MVADHADSKRSIDESLLLEALVDGLRFRAWPTQTTQWTQVGAEPRIRASRMALRVELVLESGATARAASTFEGLGHALTEARPTFTASHPDWGVAVVDADESRCDDWWVTEWAAGDGRVEATMFPDVEATSLSSGQLAIWVSLLGTAVGVPIASRLLEPFAT